MCGYYCFFFFVYFFLCCFYLLQKKRNTEAQESRTERGCVDGIKQSWSRTTILVRFAFWFFPVPPPFCNPTFLKLSLSLFLSSSVKIYFFVFLAAAFLPAAPAAGAVAAFTAFLLVPFGLRCVVQRCVATGLVG